MAKRLLVTRSQHDKGNHYLFAYTEPILENATSHGWVVETSDNEKNSRQALENRLTRNKPNLLILNGHGNDGTIFGHRNEPIVDENNVKILQDIIVFTRSCSALSALGPKSIQHGTTTFIGYRGKLLIPRLFERELTPLKDAVARPVLLASNIVAESLIKGNTAGESIQHSHDYSGKLILKMLTSSEPLDGATLRALINNDNELNLVGNESAKC